MAELRATSLCQFTVTKDCKTKKHPYDLRNTDPRLTRRGRIGATAAVAAVGASTPGELIIGFIAIKLIAPGRTVNLIRTPAPMHEILADFSKCPIIARAT